MDEIPKANYAYFKALNTALDDVIALYEQINPQFFVYKGINLKYAVARIVFYECFDNEFYHFYFDKRNVEEITDAFYQAIASKLANKPINIKQIAFKSRLDFREIFLRPFKKIKNYFFKPTENLKKDVFIYTHENRFVYFLNPVVKHLASYTYLKYGYLDVGKAAFDTNQPCLDLEQFVKLAYPSCRKNDFLKKTFNALITQVDLLDATFKYHKPKCLLLVEGFSANDEVASQVAKKYHITTLCIQQGWDFLSSPSSQNLSFSKMLLWGNAFIDYQQPHSPQTIFCGVGNHLLNKKSSKQKQKKVIFTLQARNVPSAFIDEDIWRDMFELIIWAATTLRDYQITVRPHPVHPILQEETIKLGEISNIKISTHLDETLNEALSSALLCVSINSATIFESIGVDTVPLILNFTDMPHHNPDIATMGLGMEAKNLQDAKQKLLYFCCNTDVQVAFNENIVQNKKELFVANGDEAIANILCEINKYL